VSLTRAQLGPGAALLAAFAGAADAASRFFLHGDPADRQRALAEVFLAESDAAQLRAPAQASLTIEERRLHLPAICVNPPALESIFNAPPVPTAA
jgi:hypothetical protein